MILSTLMPISSEASRSWAVARIALPTFVFCTIQVISSSNGTVMAITMMYLTRISIDPMCIDVRGNTLVREFGADPFIKMPKFWRMKLTPTAVISGASFGALRKPSIGEPLDDHVDQRTDAITTIITTSEQQPGFRRRTSSELSRSSMKIAASTEPIMNRSPWAKLISSMMP